MHEIYLINIAGADRPGVTHSLSQILAECEVRILDIGQATIHDQMALGMLIETRTGDRSNEALKHLLLKTHELGLSMKVKPIALGEYEQWVGAESRRRRIVTILGRPITTAAYAKLTGVLAAQGLNIEQIHRLSHRLPIEVDETTRNACIEFSVIGGPIDNEAFAAEIMRVSQLHEVDIAVQEDDMFRRHRRLVVFDMDSTLIQCEVIDELAKLAGVGERVSEITERAMRGELDFRGSFTERLGLLKGLPYAQAQAFAERLPLMDGAERLIGSLKRLGFKTAICSGGFDLFGETLQRKLGIDYVFANQLEHENGVLTGRVAGEIVDGEVKARRVRELADQMQLSLHQVIAVGDGANDLPMIRQAGLGIAFRAKPIVQANAKQAISVLGLDGILYLIGVRDRELA